MSLAAPITSSTSSFFNTAVVAQYASLSLQSTYHRCLAFLSSGDTAAAERTYANFYASQSGSFWDVTHLFPEDAILCTSANTLTIDDPNITQRVTLLPSACEKAAALFRQRRIPIAFDYQAIVQQIATKPPKWSTPGGICSGMAIQFINDYLRLNPQSPQEVVRAVSQIGKQFEDGGSMQNWCFNRLAPLLETQGNITLDEPDLYDKLLARLYDIDLTPAPPMTEELQQYCHSLPDGAYYIGQSPPTDAVGRGEHAIVYIKQFGQSFLFDPNLGTIHIPPTQDADYLTRSLANLSMASMTFFNCTLIP